MDCFFLATLNTCHARKTIQIRGRDVKILQTLLCATSGKKRKGCTVKMDTIRCPITSAIEHPICITTLAMKMRYNFTLHDRVIKFQCCVEVIKKKKVTLLWNCISLNVMLLLIKLDLLLPRSNNVVSFIYQPFSKY